VIVLTKRQIYLQPLCLITIISPEKTIDDLVTAPHKGAEA